MTTTEVIERFVERMGMAAEQDRLPRIAGHIMGLLLVEDGPLGLEDLANRLRVSRASVSTNTRLLESLGVVERVSPTGTRRDGFRICAAPGRELLKVTARQLEERTRLIAETRQALGSRPQARKRLADMERFYATVARSIARASRELSGG